MLSKACGGDRGGTIGHRDFEGLRADDGDPLPARPVVVRQHRLHERLLAGGVEVMCAVADGGAHHRLAVVDEGADGVDDHAAALRETLE